MPRRSHPYFEHPRSKLVHTTNKEKASRQTKEIAKKEMKHTKRHITKRAKQGKTSILSTRRAKRACYQTKRECLRRTNVDLDRVSIVQWEWSTSDAQTHAWTRRQVCKDTKKQRKLNGWHKASKASITTSHEAEEGVYQAHQHHKDMSHKWWDATTQASGPKDRQA